MSGAVRCTCCNHIEGVREERAKAAAYLKHIESGYRAREAAELKKHSTDMSRDIERAVFVARVANIIGRVADDLESGTHWDLPEPCAAEREKP